MKTILLGKRHGKKDWEIISGPEATVSDHIAVRDKLMDNFPINDTWENVWLVEGEHNIKGRLTFVTAKQSEASATARKQADIDFENSRAIAEKRQEDQAKAKTDAEAAGRKAEVDKLNKRHDEFRTQQSPRSERVAKILGGGETRTEK
jgi:hypothetical protein